MGTSLQCTANRTKLLSSWYFEENLPFTSVKRWIHTRVYCILIDSNIAHRCKISYNLSLVIVYFYITSDLNGRVCFVVKLLLHPTVITRKRPVITVHFFLPWSVCGGTRSLKVCFTDTASESSGLATTQKK